MQNAKPENPDEKIYLDFGDQFFKIDQKSFSPGSGPPKRNFSEKSVKKNPQKCQKIEKNPLKKGPGPFNPLKGEAAPNAARASARCVRRR